MQTNALDEALKQIGRNEVYFKVLIGVAAVFEVCGLAAFLLVMDFNTTLHWLVLIAAGLVYLTLAFWTWALAAHGNANAHRILKAVELLHQRLKNEQG